MSRRPTAPAPNSVLLSRLDDQQGALIVAHPGHELRVHGWLERAQPLTMILTDGSGTRGRSRLPSSIRVLKQAGATATEPFGRFTDRQLYQAILDGDRWKLLALAEEMAETLFRAKVNYIVGDAWEGFNPSHDVCRLLIDTAVALVQRRYQHPIADYDFLLEGSPTQSPLRRQPLLVRLRLPSDALARKWAAAQQYPELSGEVQRLVGKMGLAAFGTEYLRAVVPFEFNAADDAAPFYEAHGRRKVAAGHYDRVLLFDEHIRPLAEALRQFALEDCPCPV